MKRMLIIRCVPVFLFSIVCFFVLVEEENLSALFPPTFFMRKRRVNREVLIKKDLTDDSLNQKFIIKSDSDEKNRKTRELLDFLFQAGKRLLYMTSAPWKDISDVRAVNKILYCDPERNFTIDSFILILEERYGNVSEKLGERYGKLSKTDILLCNLIMAGFANKEISVIIKMKESSIRTKKCQLRKLFGITKEVAIDTFLKNL